MENKFNTKLGFILTAVGSSVGMANIWGFPYKFQDGGLVFLIFYIIFAILFSYLGLISEFAVGRLSNTGALGSYDYSFKSGEKNKTIGKYIGFIPLLALFMIAIGYAILVAYVIKAFVDSISGVILEIEPSIWFESFASVDYSVIPYHIIVILVTILTCIGGAKTIEKSNKIMMPAFFILFVLLAVRIVALPGSLEGYKYMLRFDPDKISLATITSAMGQAFFSLSLTGSAMVVVGAYIKKDVDITSSAKKIGFYDTLAALVASCVMIPALSVFHMDQVGGPGLLFVALPKILQNIGFGRIFSIFLYLAVTFAGISSLQIMFESVTESLIFRYKKLSRNMVLGILGIIAFACGVGMENIDKFGHYMDIVSIYIIPIGASIGAVTWFYILKKEELLGEINISSKKKYGEGFIKLGRYIYVPIAVTLTLLALIFKISF